MNDQIMLTPAALLDFLTQVEELADKSIVVSETASSIEVTIGDSTYSINTSSAETVEVDEEIVEDVQDINEATLDNLAETDLDEFDDVEGGPIKEFFKTLLVGGLVRFAGKEVAKQSAKELEKSIKRGK